jgi:hypothetical protein
VRGWRLLNSFVTGTVCLWLSMSCAFAQGLAPFKVDVKSWPRQSVGKIGCALEKLGHRDPVFNCSLKNYKSYDNPCGDTRRYHEGPVFPKALLPRVHPRAVALDLTFEHGDLQWLLLTLQGEFSPAQVWTALGLPDRTEAQFHTQYGMPWSVEARAGKTSVSLQGFDHMGAGDVDCSKEKPEEKK